MTVHHSYAWYSAGDFQRERGFPPQAGVLTTQTVSTKIPIMIKGTLLLFGEGRKNSRRDGGDIDMLLKRSEDSGRTWSKPQPCDSKHN